MRPEALQVVLRPRTPWQAVELGTALVRRHAGAVWRVWLLFSVPVLVLLNALCWWLDQLWLAALLMWWLLPLFDLAPVYVLSRAVFGQIPGALQTLAALPGFGRGQRVAHLLWRRFSPWRTLGLPVDVLEDGSAAVKHARRGLLVRGLGGYALLLAWLCLGFALLLALALALVGLVVVFVPGEFLSESVRALWATLVTDPPRWVQVALNAALWFGFSLIEPFHVGAGFGLYLNRRVHVEGWDIELALRSLHARLARTGPGGSGSEPGLRPRTLLLVACLPLLALAHPLPVLAQEQNDGAAAAASDNAKISAKAAAERAVRQREQRTLADVFGTHRRVDADGFLRAVDAAGRDPLLHPYRTEQVWVPRARALPPPETRWYSLWSALARVLAVIGEALLWLLAAVLGLVLILSAPRWWPWMRARAARGVSAQTEVMYSAFIPDVAPARIAASARALWQDGHWRQALALLYRGSVAALARRLDLRLRPGATEAECLSVSQRLRDADARAAFAQLVRVWRLAAYAGRRPADAEFAALTDALAQHFGWRS